MKICVYLYRESSSMKTFLSLFLQLEILKLVNTNKNLEKEKKNK